MIATGTINAQIFPHLIVSKSDSVDLEPTLRTELGHIEGLKIRREGRRLVFSRDYFAHTTTGANPELRGREYLSRF